MGWDGTVSARADSRGRRGMDRTLRRLRGPGGAAVCAEGDGGGGRVGGWMGVLALDGLCHDVLIALTTRGAKPSVLLT